MVHPAYFENMVKQRLELAMSYSKYGLVNEMINLLDDADGLIKSKSACFSSDFLENYVQEKETLFYFGFVNGLSKNINDARAFSEEGDVEKFYDAVDLVKICAKELGEQVPDFSSEKISAYNKATSKNINESYNFLDKKDFDTFKEFVSLANSYFKETNNFRAEDIALLNNLLNSNSVTATNKSSNLSSNLNSVDKQYIFNKKQEGSFSDIYLN
ncbi:MAG: hypothetical protein ACLFN8_01150 [Candidatus Woesearchaeota archaeon]